MGRAPWPVLSLLVLILSAVFLRVVAAERPGLWADEIFSLAMATGHSLEHAAETANAQLGDFVEQRDPQPAGTYRRFASLENPPAGARRVVRAVLLSDTSPPLYYLLLNQWVRTFGTSDAALRLFSVWWSVLALPLIWLLGREIGGERVAWAGCLLFSFSPVAIYYSAEGRMYSLLWFAALSLAWLTIRLAQHPRPALAALWVLSGAAGLLTHYFFVFVWLACVAWLLARLHRSRWLPVIGLVLLTCTAVLPWYLHLPESLARWRITSGWLDGDLTWTRALEQPFALAGSLLSGESFLGGWRWADLVVSAFILVVIAGAVRAGSLRRLFSGSALLLWAWLAGACTGPVIFDLLRHTTTSEITRYAQAGLPAAVLLLALGVSQLPRRFSYVVLTGILIAWAPGARKTAFRRVSRPWEPYPQLAARLDAWASADDLILLRSIPSGAVGVARYLERDLPVAPWVTRLGVRRVPDDVERLLQGRRRVALVKIRNFGDDSLESWLRAHAQVLGRDTFRRSSAEVLYLAPSPPQGSFAGLPSGLPQP